MTRRQVLLAAAAGAAPLAGCATAPAAGDRPPILFVHGNGDTAALWTTTIWRFESNGWPRERLFALDLPYPNARNEDDKPQPGRTSIAEYTAFLAAEVQKVRAATGAARVVLVGNSRGGYPIRSFVAAPGGAAQVSHVVLGGVPNHGVWAHAGFLPGSEFNGAGPFLSRLNAPRADGSEVEPGIRWLTVRSDANDKFAQPDGVWLGQRGTPTRVGFDGPALKGAENVVIAGIDHRETSFGPAAFEHAWRFLTGQAPATTAVVAEARVVLDGTVSGFGLDNRSGDFTTNLPLVGATVEVFAVDAASGERRGAALQRRTIGADGRWGPFATGPQVALEIVIAAPGYATTHVYRSPFPRSSSVVSLRPLRLGDADRAAAAVVVMSRPRGYFGVPRDRIALDGTRPAAGLPSGVAGVSEARVRLADAAPRAVVGAFNDERIVGRVWPTAENRLSLLELTW